MTINLNVRLLNAEAFEPFGSVIETREKSAYPINDGMAERHHRLAVAEALASPEDDTPGRSIISLFETRHQTLPLHLRILEQHPLGSQAFFPLDGRLWLVVVAGGHIQPDLSDLHAFIANGDQGVNYAPGVWHHPLIALDHPSRFLVVDREGTGNNLNEFRLNVPVIVDQKTAEA